MNLPDYNFLSAPLWLITVLHIVTLTLHFVAMNFLFGGIVILLFSKIQDKWNNPVVLKFVKLFPSAMAATVSFAVAPLLFLQLVYAKQAYAASIVSAWFWIMIFVVAIVSYYFLYGAAFAKEKNKSKIGLYLSISLAGFLYISFIYSSVFSLVERPDLYQTLYAGNQSGLQLNTEFGTYIFRWLHMMLGAITVGAFFVGWLGKDDDNIYSIGKNFYLWGMAAAMILGFVYMFTFGDFLIPFMRTPAIWWLLVSIILSLGSLHFFMKKNFFVSGSMLFVSLIGMVTIRHYVRLMYLENYFDPSTIPVRPEWLVFILFLIFFVIAIGLIWYMLRLFFKEK